MPDPDTQSSPFTSPSPSFELSDTDRLIDRSMAGKDDGDVSLEGASQCHRVLGDPQMEGLSLYEKKGLLVNRELDAHGMGKYQWYVFFLCGFGYLIDLLYAQAFGLVEVRLFRFTLPDKIESGLRDTSHESKYSTRCSAYAVDVFHNSNLV